MDAEEEACCYHPPPMKPKRLTLPQVATLTAIRNHQHLYGHSPSIAELAQHAGRARGTICQRLRSLERKGVLRRDPRKHRTLEIINPSLQAVA